MYISTHIPKYTYECLFDDPGENPEPYGHLVHTKIYIYSYIIL